MDGFGISDGCLLLSTMTATTLEAVQGQVLWRSIIDGRLTDYLIITHSYLPG